ncbi:MAG: hypothetical protein HC788_13460 [Sphingopyxis sp.]|nr:hypothetical protein [Sphingopyxis sp.]
MRISLKSSKNAFVDLKFAIAFHDEENFESDMDRQYNLYISERRVIVGAILVMYEDEHEKNAVFHGASYDDALALDDIDEVMLTNICIDDYFCQTGSQSWSVSMVLQLKMSSKFIWLV